MTTEQLKEKYTTGEWIPLYLKEKETWAIPSWHKEKHSGDYENGYFAEGYTYTLIHKKHSEVLDHVLNGGKVNKWWGKLGLVKGWQLEEDFFGSYDMYNKYEIIKDKPSLNGHYCLATKEHYEKLIENGIPINSHPLSGEALDFKYILVRKTITGFDEIPKAYQDKPMHLHNNEWVLGFLTHEKHCDLWTSDVIDNFTKPVKRITREDVVNSLLDYYRNGGTASEKAEPIVAYIEYLEANQKEK